MSELDELERHAYEGLAVLRREYEARAKPFIAIIEHVNSIRPIPPMILDVGTLGIALCNATREDKTMRPCPKERPIRSQKLRDAAKSCPRCMHCGAANPGADENLGQLLCLCHPPRGLTKGHGMGLKANDLGAYLDKGCHDLMDNRTGVILSPTEQDEMFLNAFYHSTVWLIQSGRLG